MKETYIERLCEIEDDLNSIIDDVERLAAYARLDGQRTEFALAASKADVMERDKTIQELRCAQPTEAERRVLGMWPRYEDGEPVLFGDEVDGLSGRVSIVEFYADALNVFSSTGPERVCDHAHLAPGERVKRPAVLAADEKPLEVGQTVWHEDGTELRVLGFEHEEDGERIVRVEYVSGPTEWSEVRSLSLTHVKPEPPDSWERIEEDAEKPAESYWGCAYADCCDCPAKVDGRKPWERYVAGGSCSKAMQLDIVRRCKALSEGSE